jgi:ElaB/YqjD/DUF883 family membrane-anchored ribosome-binding protein
MATTTKDTVSDFKSGTDYTADRAKGGIDDARSTIKDAANRYGAKADEALNQVQDTYQDVKQQAQQQIGDVERQIRANPVQATLIAAGVGFLVGALLTR